MDKYLIAGLGNPGKEYIYTRHNFGFLAIDYLKNLLSKLLNREIKLSFYPKFKSEISIFNFLEKQVFLAKPQSFMNESGRIIKIIDYFYKPQKIIIIYDDINLPLGMIRMRNNGSSGGHKGIESIIQNIGNDFFRVKLGIGPQPKIISREKFVLQNFSNKEKQKIKFILRLALATLIEKIKNNNFENITLKI